MSNSEALRGAITARVMDYENGIRVILDVNAVRIRSKEYVLLIMEDYTPTIGLIEGSVVFLCNDEEVAYNDIVGFYKLQDNEFSILIDNPS